MPVAIVGSGRCGSSMVAGLLSHCGLYVGEEADLMPADEHNPKGYWEHLGLATLNNRLLAHLTDVYGSPALAPAGWEREPGIAAFYDEARSIIQRTFSSHSLWGWKYPHASLVIPFWRQAAPGLKFVICMRNPLDSISSTIKAFSAERLQAEQIWMLYTLKALLETRPEERYVTFYENYFPDCRAELFPVLGFVGLQEPKPGSEADRAIADFEGAGLVHHNSSVEDLLADGDVLYLMRQLYLELLQADRSASDLPLLRQADLFMPLLATAFEASTIRHQLKHLERVLDSRTHRLASAICSVLIRIRGK